MPAFCITKARSSRRRVAPEIGEAVERALQNEDSGVLVNDLGAAVAAHVGFNQAALDSGRRQALIPKCDRQFGQFGKIAGEHATTTH